MENNSYIDKIKKEQLDYNIGILAEVSNTQKILKEIMGEDNIILTGKSKIELMEIAYLKGITEYSIWADCIRNGDAKYEEYEKRLSILLNK